MKPPKNERGFILLLTFAFLIVLVEITAAMTILISGETLDIGAQNDDKRLFYLADAGVERALREIRDDYTSTTQTGIAQLRGSAASVAGGSIDNIERLYYYDNDNITLESGSGDKADLKVFDSNYANTRIIKLEIVGVARRQTGGGGSASGTLQISYSLNGTTWTVALSQTITSTSHDEYEADVTAHRVWTWADLMSANFTLRAEQAGGNRNVIMDTMFLRVTYAIDTLTEPWATGTYQAYPLSLGGGTVQSVSITDEQSKIHLNTASEILLRDLMQELGIASAATLADAIDNYRSANPFDSVEELNQVTGMSAFYDTVKDYVTVYAFINPYVKRTAVSRAPVNVNTASRQVLEAIFDSLSLGSTDAASLATDIINARTTAPFTCFYTADSSITTDLYDFITGRSYLSSTGNPDEEDRVADNADASMLTPTENHDEFDAVSTEFCYDSGAFKIESVAMVGGRSHRVKTILNNQGARIFTTYATDTTSTGYRKENFE